MAVPLWLLFASGVGVAVAVVGALLLGLLIGKTEPQCPGCTIISGTVISSTGAGPTICVRPDAGGKPVCAEARLSKLPDPYGAADTDNHDHGYLPPVGRRVNGVYMRLVQDTDAPDPTVPAWVYFRQIG
ncbi:MAG: hypothetical protein QOC82_2014 [Frankiaceae bacterium]|nr:hypothetical protein [Frankiaceae bacterium]